MANLPVAVKRYIEEDKNYASQLRYATRTQETRRRDMKFWQKFSSFLGSKDPWKAGPEEVAAWCAWRADNGISAKSISSEISTLNYIYERLGKGFFRERVGQGTIFPSPGKSQLVTQTLAGIRILNPYIRISKLPLSLDCLEKVIDAQPDTLAGARNSALFALTWAGARRVREIISLDIGPDQGGSGYFHLRDDGLVIALTQSKMHPYRESPEYYGVPRRVSAPRYCPIRLVEKWIRISEITSGPLFPGVCRNITYPDKRTHPPHVTELLKNSLVRIGISADDYGARSFRSGCIEWLISEGVHPLEIRNHTGHSNISNMMGYLRNAATIKSSPLAKTRWVD